MEIILAVVLGILVGAGTGFAFASLSARKKAESAQTQIADLREISAGASAEARAAKEQLAKTEVQLAELGQQKLAEQQQESKVIERLAPVSKSVQAMQEKITQLEESRLRQEENLYQTIGQLQATTNTLAGTLTKSQERGRWGEVQLEQIFENAGLIEGVHFDRQSTTASGMQEDTRIRPDFLLRLPNKRIVPIDAKVPFDSYDKACEIPLSAEPDDLLRRDELLKKHAAALKEHVKLLSRKEYGESLPGAPDFVVAFLPAEALLSAALEADPQLVDFAFSQRVALASPVTLWSIVKSIAYAWQQQEATENAQEIVDAGKELFNRVVVIAKHSTDLKKSLEKSVSSYNKFASSLERNLYTQAEKLQKLDMSKQLPVAEQIDSAVQDYSKQQLLGTDDD